MESPHNLITTVDCIICIPIENSSTLPLTEFLQFTAIAPNLHLNWGTLDIEPIRGQYEVDHMIHQFYHMPHTST